jgi:crossover junction endodeoxyribonuclease RuvC
MCYNEKPIRILGIDPGTRITGYSIIDAYMPTPALVEAGCIKTGQQRYLQDRIRIIYDDIKVVIQNFQPDVLVIEELYSHYNHPKTAIIMGHARGVIFLCAAEAGISVKSFSATKIKSSIIGNGHASKLQVQNAVKRIFNLKEIPKPPDVADAIAAGLCYCNIIKFM